MESQTGAMKTARTALGAVVIGRNEGDRLRKCLESLLGQVSILVYVDSGSSDGSVALARHMGVVVVKFDPGTFFTAARARNAGFARLSELAPQVDLVQFVDGDCEVVANWIETATQAIVQEPSVAIVCGRRRERFPQATIYNHLCDIEWNTPVGEAKACGGDAMMRVAALREVGGYNPELIAGEEPDLCLRLRRRGHRIVRLDAEMTWHDADIRRFGQWWKRTIRGGYAHAEGFTRHRGGKEKYCAKQVRSNLAWGVFLPLVALGLAVPSGGFSATLLAGYLVLALRVVQSSRRRGLSWAESRLYASFCVLGKFPSAWGQLRYWLGRLVGKRSRLIEYKGPAA
jgi:GT2 family glycosyltransferase